MLSLPTAAPPEQPNLVDIDWWSGATLTTGLIVTGALVSGLPGTTFIPVAIIGLVGAAIV